MLAIRDHHDRGFGITGLIGVVLNGDDPTREALLSGVDGQRLEGLESQLAADVLLEVPTAGERSIDAGRRDLERVGLTEQRSESGVALAGHTGGLGRVEGVADDPAHPRAVLDRDALAGRRIEVDAQHPTLADPQPLEQQQLEAHVADDGRDGVIEQTSGRACGGVESHERGSHSRLGVRRLEVDRSRERPHSEDEKKSGGPPPLSTEFGAVGESVPHAYGPGKGPTVAFSPNSPPKMAGPMAMKVTLDRSMNLLGRGTLALMRACEVALVQVCAGPDPEPNVRRASECCAQALAEGAELIVLPEGYAEIPPGDRGPTWRFDPDAPETGAAIAPFVALSHAHPNAILVLGGVPEAIPGEPRHYNTCVVVNAGRVVARYRKIHLFELSLPDQPALSESRRVAPGNEPMVVATPLGRIGLSICYDLRFPELYRSLVSAGAELLVVPAAFTHTTGLAHWEVLLRARAIESQCWLLAAAQWGVHGSGPRRSFGHSMIIDPWGRVVARLDEGDGLVRARIEPEPLERARGVLPALEHRVLARETPATIVTLSGVPEA